MKFPPHLLDDIRARLPVSTVVGRRVKLTKAGREWRGLSPFQKEKTPSFYVNDQKGFYHCFSSGKHGDIFRFVMETEGLSFPEVVERLAAEAGVTLPKITPEAEAQEKKRRDLYDVTELAAKFFEAELQKSTGAAARAYLDRRQFSPRTQAEFRFGYAPDSRDALLTYMRQHGVSDQQLIDTGLVIQPEDGRGVYDRFRGRVIIPIQDGQGRVVAFGGRVLDPEAKPKYLNSPETALFHKGHMVFNGHRAREAAFKAGSVVVVEGYLDAIALHQAGLKHVVATLGTAFTEEQIATLWRFAPEPIVCFDGDKAGAAAANRAIDRILPALKTGNSFRFAFLPSGQDPDDLVKAKGIEGFTAVLMQAMPLWDALWRRETASADVSTPDRQAMLEKSFRQLIDQIADPLVKRRYELSARLRLNQFFWEKRPNTRGGTAGSNKTKAPLKLMAGAGGLKEISAEYTAVERLFLGMVVHFPDLAERHRERISGVRLRGTFESDGFGKVTHERFLGDLLRVIGEYEHPAAFDFYNLLDPYFMDMLDGLHGREDRLRGLVWGYRLLEAFPVLKAQPDESFVERCFDQFVRMLELREGEMELQELSSAPADAITDRQLERLMDLKRELESARALMDEAERVLAEEAMLVQAQSVSFAQSVTAKGPLPLADMPEF